MCLCVGRGVGGRGVWAMEPCGTGDSSDSAAGCTTIFGLSSSPPNICNSKMFGVTKG